MCVETIWDCSDCGAERSIAWDYCHMYWTDYAKMLEDPNKGVKPDPTFCPMRQRDTRPFRLGACPNLNICPSKPRHEVQLAQVRYLAATAVSCHLQKEEIGRRQRKTFARNHFAKIPVPGAPAYPKEMEATPPMELLDMSTESSQGEEEASPQNSPRPLLRRKGRGKDLREEFAAGELQNEGVAQDSKPLFDEARILDMEEQDRQASWTPYIAGPRSSSSSTFESAYFTCPCSPIPEEDEEEEGHEESPAGSPRGEYHSGLSPELDIVGNAQAKWKEGHEKSPVGSPPGEYRYTLSPELDIVGNALAEWEEGHEESPVGSPPGEYRYTLSPELDIVGKALAEWEDQDRSSGSPCSVSSSGTVLHSASSPTAGGLLIVPMAVRGRPHHLTDSRDLNPTVTPPITTSRGKRLFSLTASRDPSPVLTPPTVVGRGERTYRLTEDRNLSLALTPPPLGRGKMPCRLTQELDQNVPVTLSTVVRGKKPYRLTEDRNLSLALTPPPLGCGKMPCRLTQGLDQNVPVTPPTAVRGKKTYRLAEERDLSVALTSPTVVRGKASCSTEEPNLSFAFSPATVVRGKASRMTEAQNLSLAFTLGGVVRGKASVPTEAFSPATVVRGIASRPAEAQNQSLVLTLGSVVRGKASVPTKAFSPATVVRGIASRPAEAQNQSLAFTLSTVVRGKTCRPTEAFSPATVVQGQPSPSTGVQNSSLASTPATFRRSKPYHLSGILSNPAIASAWNRLRNPEPVQRFQPQLPSPIPIPVPGRGYPRAPKHVRRWFS